MTDLGPKRAIVLSGGGARGAYEAGVLAYLFQEFPRETLRKGRIHLFCGTSVGAIHACHLASAAHIVDYHVDRIIDVWRGFRLEESVRFSLLELLQLPKDLLSLFRKSSPHKGLLLNAAKLCQRVFKEVQWAQIRANLRSKQFEGITVSATHIKTGSTRVFADLGGNQLPAWSRDERVVPLSVRLGPQHALASAAMPFIFPPVRIGGDYFCDGGVRQNTPLSPALRLGADRVLIIGLRHETPMQVQGSGSETQLSERPNAQYPSPMYMLGKIVDSIMLDRLEYDLKRLDGFNALVERDFNPTTQPFVDRFNSVSEQMRGSSYRNIEKVVIRPSRNIGEMAAEFIDVFKAKLGVCAGWLFQRIALSDELGGSDLLSYLLFDGHLATALMELGRADAHASRNALADFLRD